MEQNKPRKILVEFLIDWEDYEDVADELIIEDAVKIDKAGVSYQIIQQKIIDGTE